MNAKKLYLGTMKFCLYKLLLGIATVLISAVLFAVIVGIFSLFGDGGTGIGLIVWLCATGIVRFFLMHYAGYMVKAGHIAILATAMTEGRIPENQFETAKTMVKERFLTSNVYFAIDKLVGGAVKQLQRMVGKVGNLFGAVPGVDVVVKAGQLFIDISLGYVDECCLGYTFVHKEQGAFKSAADGVVIYAQNWKPLLKSAAKTTLVVILAIVLVTAASFALIGGLFSLFNWNILAAFALAAMIAFAVKYAFIDSWILCKTMTVYMGLAQTTQITFDLYGKLCNLSAKFKELFDKGRAEPGAAPAYAAAGASYASPAPNTEPAAGSVFCGQCGGKNDRGTKFCASCGAKL